MGFNGGDIDLNDAFEILSWCRVNGRNGDYFVKLTPEEVAVNDLPDDPFSVIPVVCYDLETIADNMNAVPRGVERHHRLSSVVLTVHAPFLGVDGSAIALAYAPVRSETELDARQEQVRAAFAAARHDEVCAAVGPNVTMYRNERDLLGETLALLRRNAFLVDLYELDDPRDAERLACVLLGYNSWEYDYAFVWSRMHYYGWHAAAIKLQKLAREPRFCDSQISFDLMKHVAARYRPQVGSIALSNVSRYFGAQERIEGAMSRHERYCKMSFDAVSIRRLYYDMNATGDAAADRVIERFDERGAFDDMRNDAGLNMLRVLRYNVQDCLAVYHLARNLTFFDTVSLYARHFMVSAVDASHVGNSRLLPNAFAVRALQKSNAVLHYRCNTLSQFTVQREANENATHTPRELLNATTPLTDAHPTTAAHVSNERALLRVDGKSYVGGVNSATPGHYARPITVDFSSFYPSIGCQFVSPWRQCAY